MEAGWRRIGRTVAVTATVTSAFWVLLFGWLYFRHLGSDHPATRADQPSVGKLAVPVAGVRPEQLSDTFSDARAAGARRHDAIDIMASEGAPVIAAAPGRVEKLFQSHDGGTTAYVRSPDGRTLYYYAHLSAYAPGLAEGAELKTGAPVGRVGHTGNASAEAPHLHFAVMRTAPDRKWYEETTALNPYPLLTAK